MSRNKYTFPSAETLRAISGRNGAVMTHPHKVNRPEVVIKNELQGLTAFRLTCAAMLEKTNRTVDIDVDSDDLPDLLSDLSSLGFDVTVKDTGLVINW